MEDTIVRSCKTWETKLFTALRDGDAAKLEEAVSESNGQAYTAEFKLFDWNVWVYGGWDRENDGCDNDEKIYPWLDKIFDLAQGDKAIDVARKAKCDANLIAILERAATKD